MKLSPSFTDTECGHKATVCCHEVPIQLYASIYAVRYAVGYLSVKQSVTQWCREKSRRIGSKIRSGPVKELCIK
jgi:hypothetical protein